MMGATDELIALAHSKSNINNQIYRADIAGTIVTLYYPWQVVAIQTAVVIQAPPEEEPIEEPLLEEQQAEAPLVEERIDKRTRAFRSRFVKP